MNELLAPTPRLTADAPIISDVTDLAYYADHSAVSQSMMKDFRKSHAYFHALYIAKTIQKKAPTKDMIIGTAFHSLGLEPRTFASKYAAAPECDRRNNVGKAIWKEFSEANEGKTIIDNENMELLAAMGRTLLDNPLAKRWLYGERGEVEKVLRWKCPATGIERKAKLDWLSTEHRLIIDLKSCEDASPSAFARDIGRFYYDNQAATYLEAVQQIYGPGEWGFLFLAISKEDMPHVGCYLLNDRALAMGHEDNRQQMIELKKCIDTGDWADRWSCEPTEIEAPRWKYPLLERKV